MNTVVEATQGTIAESATKHVHKTPLAEAIFKATQSKITPPKPKHERVIITETWQSRTSSHVLSELFKRALGGKEIVLWKTLVIVHKMMRDGHPQVLDDVYARKDYLDSLLGQYNGNETPWGVLDEAYLQFVIEKVKFHRTFPEVGGEISLQKYREKQRKFNAKIALPLVTKLIDLQKAILTLQSKTLTMVGLNECRLAAMVPALIESYGIFTMFDFYIRKLVDADEDVSDLIENFEKQYPVLQKFYFTCSTIPYVASQISVPTLPQQCPTFPKTDKAEKKKKKKEQQQQQGGGGGSNLVNPNTNPGNLLGSTGSTGSGSSSLLGSGSGLLSSNSGLLGSGSGLLGSGSGLLGSGSGLLGSGSGLAQPTQSLNSAFGGLTLQASTSTPFGVQNNGGFGSFGGGGSANVFGANNSAFGGSLVPVSNNNPFGAPASFQAQPPMTQPVVNQQPQQSRSPFENLYEASKATHYQEPVMFANSNAYRNQSMETKEMLEKKLRELESRLKELQIQNQDMEGQNNEMRLLLNDRDNGLASVRVQMEERLRTQQRQFQEANNALTSHVERMMQKYEKEKLSLVTEQVEFAKKGIDQTLFKFDDPNSLGNRGSNGEDIIQCATQVQSNYEAVLKSLDTEGDTVGASRALSESTAKLLDDTKGALQKIVDPNVKYQLGEASRNVARETGRILSHTLQLVQQGKPDERQKQFLLGEHNRFVQQLNIVRAAINASHQVLNTDHRIAELEMMAEKELEATSKVIFEMSSILQSKQSQFSNTTGLDVQKSLVDSVMAITNGTQLLVKAVSASQQEYVKREMTGAIKYEHRDPMWTEAIIAASRELSQSIRQLVSVAFNAQGKIDDQALVAASRSIASATSKLVSASRAKTQGGTNSHIALDNAAAAIMRATRSLVDAAKSFSNVEEFEILKKSDTFKTQVGEEIERQSRILRLEKELEWAKKQLAQIKRDKQMGQPPSSPQVPTLDTSFHASASFSSSLPPSSSGFNPFL
eukprot:TRINITY_DN3847_c0_g1_i1.p1 TRINITY_DN3847_c0_g1~~TRINITY_DN3847_c0_g1_i1.p1  ORF type:complete len:996 (+),score=296.10 TRINITY_DN3847_c0_g1_i1:7-2994(+)